MAESSSEMSDKEKEELAETVKEVSKSLTVDPTSQNLSAVIAAIGNSRGKTLRLYATTSWVGEFHVAPSDSVNAGGRVQFSHRAPRGPQGALIYGEERQVSNPAGYLLAWSMSNFTLRVYVKCGPLSQVHHTGWEGAALASLNSSGANSSSNDAPTSSRAQARIYDDTLSFPLAVVQAIFG